MNCHGRDGAESAAGADPGPRGPSVEDDGADDGDFPRGYEHGRKRSGDIVPVDDVLLLDRSPEDEQERSCERCWAVHGVPTAEHKNEGSSIGAAGW